MKDSIRQPIAQMLLLAAVFIVLHCQLAFGQFPLISNQLFSLSNSGLLVLVKMILLFDTAVILSSTVRTIQKN